MNVVLMGIVRSCIDDTISCEYEKGMTLKQIMIVKNKGPVNAQKQYRNFRYLFGVANVHTKEVVSLAVYYAGLGHFITYEIKHSSLLPVSWLQGVWGGNCSTFANMVIGITLKSMRK